MTAPRGCLITWRVFFLRSFGGWKEHRGGSRGAQAGVFGFLLPLDAVAVAGFPGSPLPAELSRRGETASKPANDKFPSLTWVPEERVNVCCCLD